MCKTAKRIVLVDDKVISDPLKFFGCGLGKEIYTTSQLKTIDQSGLDILFNIGPQDGVMLIGPGSFDFLKSRYHFGIRSENYFDCSLLKRLGISGGGFVKVIHESELPDPEDIQYFMSSDFCKHRDFSYLQTRIIKTIAEAISFLEYFYSQPLGTNFGFDYETSGMPMEKIFSVTGAAISMKTASAFFSFTEIIKRSSPKDIDNFMSTFRLFLEKHHRSTWTFNVQFEQQVTWRIFGLEAEFRDASVYNVLDGLHSKNYSLKWSTQRLLGGGDTQTPNGIGDFGGIEPWDTDFDKLEELLDRMYYVIIQDPQVKGKKGQIKTLKCSLSDYQVTPEWKELCTLYPKYVPEFEELIRDNFGNPFLNIPADILGYYCCLDSFYTLLIHLENETRYTDLCRDTFSGNQRLGARLHRGGLYINENFRQEYDRYCDRMMFWGILYSGTFRCKYKIDKHKSMANNIESYNSICQTLILRGEFHNGEILEITKDILIKNLDNNNTTDTGLDEGKMLLIYGQDFAEKFIDVVKESIIEIKFKGKIDSGISRKKKILGVISEKLTRILELDKLTLGEKHQELEKLLYYQKAYSELLGLWKQVQDINNVPDTVYFFRKTMDISEATEMIMEKYFRCSSPIDNSEITKELIEMFRLETVFLSSIFKESNKLPGENKYYENLGISTPQGGFEHYCSEFKVFYDNLNKKGICNWPLGYTCQYPIDLWITSSSYWKDSNCDPCCTTWESFEGWDKQSMFFKEDTGNLDIIRKPYSEEDYQLPRFTLMRKILINILLYKKYGKIKNTYLNGLFQANSKYVIEGPELVPIRDADSEEFGAVKKSFPRFEIMKKETKRWSSGFHTIPSHMDVKDCVTTPPGFFMSYFDISSAEIRTLAFRSGDTNLIDLFKKGIDVYIYVARQHLGDDHWNLLGKDERKKWRKKTKVLFLAIAYRMSVKTLAKNLNIPETEAQQLMDTLFGQFPLLEKYIESNAAWPEVHKGFINTELGDTLRCSDYRFAFITDPVTGQKRVDKWKMLKIGRAGINYKIQSFSALALANGFNNTVEKARQRGIPMTNIIVVHDSSEQLFPIDMIFDIKKFYEDEFLEYCYSKYGIEFKFDLLVGTAYNSMVELKTISETEIEVSGDGRTLGMLFDKINTESTLKVELSIPRVDIIPQLIQDSMERFISDRGCCMIKDTSSYTVRLKKIP